MKSFTRPLGLALGCAASLLLFPTGFAQPATPPLPEELIVLRSQPSVFKVFAYGDIAAAYPQQVTLKTALLDREYASRPPGAVSKAQFIWSRIAGDPSSYLETSAERGKLVRESKAYASGTAFAVSREGILLTNAHVLRGPNTEHWNMSSEAMELLDQPYTAFCEYLIQAIGERPSPANLQGASDALDHWYFAMVSTTGRFTEARLALKYGFDGDKLEEVSLGKKVLGGEPLGQDPSAPKAYIKKAPLPPFPNGKPRAHKLVEPELEPVTRPLKVLAIGNPFPGEDVAVLQVMLDAEDKMTPLGTALQGDRLICLPLGNSDLVLPGSQIHALGFPGKAYFAPAMDPSAEMQVSSRPGEIGQTKRLRGGLDVFEMTAEIDHGDSGGPVLDKNGNVIAITVAGVPADEDADKDNKASAALFPGHKLAVPINIARKYLRQAGVTPDRGVTGQLWDESLRMYNQHKFTDALRTLENLRLMQEGIHINPMLSLSVQMPKQIDSPFISPYLDRLLDICSKTQFAPK